MGLTLVFDIGGTKTRLAVSPDRHHFTTPKIFLSPRRYVDGLHAIAREAKTLAGLKRITQIVGGVAATLNPGREHLLGSPHLHGWIGKPFKRDLERVFHAPVLLENDADLVGLGESVAGAGRGVSILAYITVSTGIGGTRIVDGKIDRAHLGFEPGHQIIDYRAIAPCDCGGHGDWESLASGRAVERRFHRHPKTILNQRTWRGLSELIGIGLVNVCVFWSPERIVLGGSMMKKPGVLMPVVRRTLRRRLPLFPILPPLVRGTLGDFGGLYGALALARQTKR